MSMYAGSARMYTADQLILTVGAFLLQSMPYLPSLPNLHVQIEHFS